MFVLKSDYDRAMKLAEDLRASSEKFIMAMEKQVALAEALAQDRGASLMFVRGQLEDERARCDKLLDRIADSHIPSMAATPLQDPPTRHEADLQAVRSAREAKPVPGPARP